MMHLCVTFYTLQSTATDFTFPRHAMKFSFFIIPMLPSCNITTFRT
uniref:Uncharacterized protein n=1 Tax=Arundo donax TaxID=35708 RepID=A0A0A9HRS0_ARUDO